MMNVRHQRIVKNRRRKHRKLIEKLNSKYEGGQAERQESVDDLQDLIAKGECEFEKLSAQLEESELESEQTEPILGELKQTMNDLLHALENREKEIVRLKGDVVELKRANTERMEMFILAEKKLMDLEEKKKIADIWSNAKDVYIKELKAGRPKEVVESSDDESDYKLEEDFESYEEYEEYQTERRRRRFRQRIDDDSDEIYEENCCEPMEKVDKTLKAAEEVTEDSENLLELIPMILFPQAIPPFSKVTRSGKCEELASFDSISDSENEEESSDAKRSSSALNMEQKQEMEEMRKKIELLEKKLSQAVKFSEGLEHYFQENSRWASEVAEFHNLDDTCSIRDNHSQTVEESDDNVTKSVNIWSDDIPWGQESEDF